MRKESYNNQDKEIKLIKVIEAKGKTFRDVKNIKKFYKHCTKNNCKHYWECEQSGVIRAFDCQKNAKKVAALYSLITGVFVSVFTFFVLNVSSISIFKRIAIIIASMVAFDILFTFFEWVISKVRENTLYNKLNRMERKKAMLEEKQRIKDEMEGRLNNPYYDDIKNAEAYTVALKKLIEESKFGSCDEKISECVDRLMEIIVELKKDCEKYLEVAFLFEVQLPELYNTLKSYKLFFKSEKLTKEYEDNLERVINKFLLALEKNEFL